MTSTVASGTIIIDDFHQVLLDQLQAANIPFDYQPNITEKEALAVINRYETVICRSKINFTADVLNNLPNLKCIARGGAGMDNIDEVKANSMGITLINAPEGNRDAVAEHAIGMILALSNNIAKGNSEVKNKIWEREANRGFEIGGKTIGIIGFGNTGKALAAKLAGFGCRLIAYDMYSPSENPMVEAVELKELLTAADIISLHVPLTDETKYMVNQDFIAECKPAFTLINTSRGAVVENKAVLNALEEGKMSAFGADVLENEKFAKYSPEEMVIFEALASKSQVLLTPHVAGWTKESYWKISEIIANRVISFTTKLKKY
ncbi:MAG: NAD(P)-dependent oxidoreductase [Bacteroidota bacterium]